MIDEETRQNMRKQFRKRFGRLDDCCKPVATAQFTWTAKDIGFGGFYFYIDDDGKTRCSNEMMSKEFIKEMLCQMVDDCILEDPEPEQEDK